MPALTAIAALVAVTPVFLGAANQHADPTEQSDAVPAAPATPVELWSALTARYEEIDYLERSGFFAMNLPPGAREASKVGTLGAAPITVRLERGDVDVIEHALVDAGGTTFQAVPDAWLVWNMGVEEICAQISRKEIVTSAEVMRLNSDTFGQSTFYQPVLSLDMLLMTDGSLDALLGEPVEIVAPGIETFDKHSTHGTLLGYSFLRERPEDARFIRLNGARARAGLVIDSRTGVLAAGVIDIDAADLGLFEKRGARIWLGMGLEKPVLSPTTPRPAPISEGREVVSLAEYKTAVHVSILSMIDKRREEFEQQLAQANEQIEAHGADHPMRPWALRWKERVEGWLAMSPAGDE